MKQDLSRIERPDPFCANDQLVELWNIEHKVHEESYSEPVKFGSIDSGNEVFQIFTNTFETKGFECGENDAGGWRSASSVGARSRGLESYVKGLETGQRGQTSGHRLG